MNDLIAQLTFEVLIDAVIDPYKVMDDALAKIGKIDGVIEVNSSDYRVIGEFDTEEGDFIYSKDVDEMETAKIDEINKIYDHLTALHEWLESLEDLTLRIGYEVRDYIPQTNIQDVINDYRSKMENL